MNVVITENGPTVLYQLVGPGADRVLTDAGLPCPSDDLSAASNAQGVIVARTGSRTYLVIGTDAPPRVSESPPWCFARFDSVFTLSGPDVLGLLAHLCAYDLSRCEAGAWLMTRCAGLDVWLYRQTIDAAGGASDGAQWMLGCNPSHQRYLREVLGIAAGAPVTHPA